MQLSLPARQPFNFLPVVNSHGWVHLAPFTFNEFASHEWRDGWPVGRKDVEAALEKWGEDKGLAYWFRDWKMQGG
jgi:hypothetical protein